MDRRKVTDEAGASSSTRTNGIEQNGPDSGGRLPPRSLSHKSQNLPHTFSLGFELMFMVQKSEMSYSRTTASASRRANLINLPGRGNKLALGTSQIPTHEHNCGM